MGLNVDRGHLSIVRTDGTSQEPDSGVNAFDGFRIQQQALLLTRLMGQDIDLEEFPFVTPADDPVYGLLESIHASAKQEPPPLDRVSVLIDPNDPHRTYIKADAFHIDLPSRGGPEEFLGALVIIRLRQSQGDLVGLFGIPDPDAEPQVKFAQFFRQTSKSTYTPIPQREMYYWHEGHDTKPENFLKNAMVARACTKDTITVTKIAFMVAEDFGGDGPDGDDGIPLEFRRDAA